MCAVITAAHARLDRRGERRQFAGAPACPVVGDDWAARGASRPWSRRGPASAWRRRRRPLPAPRDERRGVPRDQRGPRRRTSGRRSPGCPVRRSRRRPARARGRCRPPGPSPDPARRPSGDRDVVEAAEHRGRATASPSRASSRVTRRPPRRRRPAADAVRVELRGQRGDLLGDATFCANRQTPASPPSSARQPGRRRVPRNPGSSDASGRGARVALIPSPRRRPGRR